MDAMPDSLYVQYYRLSLGFLAEAFVLPLGSPFIRMFSISLCG